ncbi:Nodulin MtN21 /EamA-like transporter family protein [Hibiscus syriacus]|uniref:Nodulin MtN21 /EamA-like transporter family protein n=1 Tax=Hibiscus syriacus TaxID=106335 RepID=A0A6A2XY06_HIBSY|nr:Nodulin MtN21 /EamA-like transporter family protein [Hibiscus syriacus]
MKTTKRFGLEGGETLIPGMKEMFDRAADLGVECIVVEMSHRGRLNVLGNVFRKPLRQIFSKFDKNSKFEDESGLYTGTGDVKYHLGTSYDHPTRSGKRIHLPLVANPSYLEAPDRQGVVYETLHLSALPNYTTCGTMHIVVNNQVAFTTDPRRFRHNEIDEPFFTQPNMYRVIQKHPSSLEIYKNKLLESGEVTEEDIGRMHKNVDSILNEEFLNSKDYVQKRRDWLSTNWKGFKSPEQLSRIRNTGVNLEILKKVGRAISILPKDFKPHRAVKKVHEDRAKMIETGEGLEWAMGEALAFGTLLVEVYVHVSSSLSEFGVLGFELGYSMENLDAIVIWKAQFGDFSNGAQVILDQFLSSGEAKWLRQTGLVVLLPHGYDGQGPEHSSARLERFLQMSDEDPYEIPEMDPTHRKQIQKCNWQVVNTTTPANYFHVIRRQMHREFRKPLIAMSPKNLLRYKFCKSNLSEFDDVQGHEGFDKQGTRFKRLLIKDQNNHLDLEKCIKRLVLCSGKVYYELDEERKKRNGNDIAICRVEQLCPFPFDLIQRELKRYPNAEIVWCQEESMNMGAYTYIAPRLCTAMKVVLVKGSMEDIKYAGRPPPPVYCRSILDVEDLGGVNRAVVV